MITSIKSEIKKLEGGAFQKLCDAYLSYTGYKYIHALGSQAGTNKTTSGTPDTYFTDIDGRYIFVEYTTTKDVKLANKLEKDIIKCLDTQYTGIDCKDIKKIIYCHTSSNLKPAQDKKLKEICSQKNVELELIGIDYLAQEIMCKYQILALDYLDISLDTGQILLYEDFIKSYNKSPTAAPLTNITLARENELDLLHDNISKGKVTIITGPSGIGKTQLGLSFVKEYANSKNYTLYCLANKELPIYEDLKRYISNKGRYIIFIDDANQFTKGLHHVLEYIKDDRIEIKIILTVREYALTTVEEIVVKYCEYSNVEIKSLKTDGIKKIIYESVGELNTTCINRIIKLSNGNARIAILAARIAKETGNISSINDISQLYDKYYGEVIKSTKVFKNVHTSKVSCVLAFMGKFNLGNRSKLIPYLTEMGVSDEQFNDSLKELYDAEIINIYQEAGVVFVDQCMMNYILKRMIIDEKVVKLSSLIRFQFPINDRQTIDSVNILTNLFFSESLHKYIEEETKIIWDEYSKSNEWLYWTFIRAFYPLHVTAALVEIKCRLDELVLSTEDDDCLDIGNKVMYKTLIEVLAGVITQEQSNTALALFWRYYEKYPMMLKEANGVIKLASAIKYESFKSDFQVQYTLIASLLQVSNNWEIKLYVDLFLDIASDYLQFQFDQAIGDEENKFIIQSYAVIDADYIIDFRKYVWEQIIEITKKAHSYENVLTILKRYPRKTSDNPIIIIQKDMPYILEIISNVEKKYNHIDTYLTIEHLNNIFSHYQIQSNIIEGYLRNEKYQQYKLLDLSVARKRDDSNKVIHSKLISYIQENNIIKLYQLIDICKELSQLSFVSTYQITDSLSVIFYEMTQDKTLFLSFLEYYLEMDTPLNIYPNFIIKQLFEYMEANEVKEFISKYNFKSKNKWMLIYYELLPNKYIYKDTLIELYDYFETKENCLKHSSEYRNLEFLNKYKNFDKDIYLKVYKIILKKRRYSIAIVENYFNSLFELDPIKLLNRFKDDYKMLVEIYFIVCDAHSWRDNDGKYLIAIYDVYPEVIDSYVRFIASRDNLDEYHVKRNIIFFSRDNYVEIYNQILSQLHQIDAHKTIAYIKSIISIEGNYELASWQDNWIKQYIEENATNIILMNCLFDALLELDECRRLAYIKRFISFNTNFDHFKKIQILPLSRSWSGSLIPILETELAFLTAIRKNIDGVNYLEHQEYIEDCIKDKEYQIKDRETAEFLEL